MKPYPPPDEKREGGNSLLLFLGRWVQLHIGYIIQKRDGEVLKL